MSDNLVECLIWNITGNMAANLGISFSVSLGSEIALITTYVPPKTVPYLCIPSLAASMWDTIINLRYPPVLQFIPSIRVDDAQHVSRDFGSRHMFRVRLRT